MSNDDSSEPYAEAQRRIQAALQTDATSLDLRGLQLTSVPPEIGQLASLTGLRLNYNQLTSVPPEIGQLTNLTKLYLYNNELTSVPSEIGQLANLSDLQLDSNQLTSVPPEIGQLANLTHLELQCNQLTSVPPEIGQLASLINLYLYNNQLTIVRPELGQLANLKFLNLHGNQLTSVPPEIGQLACLDYLNLEGNPLSDGMQTAYRRGQPVFLAYLRSLVRDSEPLHEAKLVLVGEGNVGKSCLLAALCGEEFVQRSTTHGIDVKDFSVAFRSSFNGKPEAPALADSERAVASGLPLNEEDASGLPLNNEDETDTRVPDGTELTLHGWDFGGQSVYRVTHQFFYSRRTLYLIVWNARDTVEKCDVIGWLERLQLRVGSEARVLIVCTQCDTVDRVPRIDRQGLRQQFGDLIPEDGFVEVDSKKGTGMDELRRLIARETAGLPQIGDRFSRSWKAARDEALAIKQPRFAFSTFQKKCRTHKLDSTETLALAGLMHDLGNIVWFSDDDTLKDSIISEPQWLSKAIGYVLEDPPTNAAAGVLKHSRLDAIWRTDREEDDQYDAKLHPFFLRLMEKFDVSYRIDEDVSLVAELVPLQQPELPWNRGTSPSEASLTLAIRFDEDPPGLVPWLIVRHHRRRFGIDAKTEPKLHWQKGVFLEDPAHGQALLELVDRELFVTVRGSYPSHLLSVLQDSIVTLIEGRWPGLAGRYHLSVPCPSPVDGKDCRGRFELEFLRELKTNPKRGTEVPCQACNQWHDIEQLLTGHASVNLVEEFGHLHERLDDNATRCEELAAAASDETQQMQEQLRELLSRQAESFRLVLKSLESESRDAPRLFSLIADDWDSWLLYWLDPRYWGKAPYRLTLWCEMPDHQHPLCEIGATGDKGDASQGEYVFTRPGEQMQQFGSLARFAAQTLKLTLPLVGAAATAGLGVVPAVAALKLMEKMADTTLAGFADTSDPAALLGEQTDELRDPSRAFRRQAGGASLREMHTLLHELDKSKRWGNLRRVFDKSSGDYLWLCHEHRLVLNPALPVLQKASDGKTT